MKGSRRRTAGRGRDGAEVRKDRGINVERLKWWLADFRDAIEGSSDAKFVGALVLLALLAGGGYIAADKASQVGAATGMGASTHLVRLVTTVREPVTTRVNGHTVVRWRVRRKVVEAQAQTVMQTATVQTPGGTKVISHPVVRYRVAYRKKVVRVNGKASTVIVPQTVTDSQTNTVSRTQTDVQTVTQPVTVVRTVTQTQTIVSTVTLPGTTVTLPGTTETVTVPVTTATG